MKTVVDRWKKASRSTTRGFWPSPPITDSGRRLLAAAAPAEREGERPFWYAELNLLNGQTFSSLEHLNQITQVWLANTADVRVHREPASGPLMPTQRNNRIS